MEDIFTRLAAGWGTETAVQLAARPVPSRPPYEPGQLPAGMPSTPPGGRTWFEVLTAHWADPDFGMDVVRMAHQRDLARAVQAPPLDVHIGNPGPGPATRFEVDPVRGVVAVTVAPLRRGPVPGPLHRVRGQHHRPPPSRPALRLRLEDAPTQELPAVRVDGDVSQVLEAWPQSWWDQ